MILISEHREVLTQAFRYAIENSEESIESYLRELITLFFLFQRYGSDCKCDDKSKVDDSGCKATWVYLLGFYSIIFAYTSFIHHPFFVLLIEICCISYILFWCDYSLNLAVFYLFSVFVFIVLVYYIALFRTIFFYLWFITSVGHFLCWNLKPVDSPLKVLLLQTTLVNTNSFNGLP